MTNETPRQVSEEDLRIVNAHFRCDYVGSVMIEKGYWQKNNAKTGEING
jgi:hypothetical protein